MADERKINAGAEVPAEEILSPTEENITPTESLVYEVVDEMGVISEKTRILGNVATCGHLAVAGTVEGDISAKGNVIVTGNVKGEIACNNLILKNCRLTTIITAAGHVSVEEGVEVCGTIKCKTIAVNGLVKGDITAAEKAALASGAQVQGNVKAASLGVEFGARIEGCVSVNSIN